MTPAHICEAYQLPNLALLMMTSIAVYSTNEVFCFCGPRCPYPHVCATYFGWHSQCACLKQVQWHQHVYHPHTTTTTSLCVISLLTSGPTYLIHSLTYGFNIGYTGPHLPLTAPNLCSAYQYPNTVDEAVKKEVAEHRMAGPFSTPPTLIYAVRELASSPRRMVAGD